MTQILYTRADGNPIGAPVDIGRGRRRLSAVLKQRTDPTRPFLTFVCRRNDPIAPLEQTHFLRKRWKSTTVGPRDTVIVVYLPRGGGGRGGSRGGANKGASIGMLVATVALAALGQFWAIGAIASAMGTTMGVAGTIWAVGSTALLGGIGYFLSRSTKSKANTAQDNRPVYGVSGGGNLPRANDRIPSVFGRCWHTPDLAQPDYFTYDGEDQILFKRLVIGCGKYSLKSIRVAGITMWTDSGGLTPAFPNSDFQLIPPGGASSLVPGAVDSIQAVGGQVLPKAAAFPNFSGPYAFTSSARPQTRIQIDYTVQASFATVSGGKFDGKQYPANWGILIQAAVCDEDGTPLTAFFDIHTNGGYSQFTRPQRYTQYVDLPSNRYTFRARNTGDQDTIEHPAGFEANITNPVVWDGLRSHIPETIVREGVTELAMKIRSGEAQSVTQFGEVEVEVQRILPVYYGAGTGWIEEETSKAIWAAVDVLRNNRSGAGRPDSEIDVNLFMTRANNITQFNTFSAVIRGPVSVYEAMTTILGPIRGSPVRLGHAWTMIRDEQTAVRKRLFTRRQILADTSNQVFTVDLADGSADVIVEWFSNGDPKQMRTERITFGSQSLTPRRISLTGVTSYDHAVHIGTYLAATAYFRREKRQIGLAYSGRLVMPNDRVGIDMWFFDRKVKAAGVVSHVNGTLVLDMDSDIDLPPGSFAYLRDRQGKDWGPVGFTSSGRSITLNSADVAQAQSLSGLTLEQVLNTDTQAETSVLLGDLTTLQEDYLVRGISFHGDTVTIEAIRNATQVWSALGEAIIEPPPPPSSGLENEAQAIVSYIQCEGVQKNGGVFMEWTIGRARNAASYVVMISYDNWASYEVVSSGTVTSGSYPLREGAGLIYVRAWGITASGIRGPTVQRTFSYVPAVIDLGNAVNGSLVIEAFTDAIEPVLLVDGLPDPVGWVKPKQVFNIQDEKLYRYTDGQWKPVFDVSDIPGGSITETMIADDSITTPKIRANAVTANEIAANSITGGKIQAGAVSANKINVTKLDAISADLGSVLAGSLNINNRFMVASDGTVTILSAASGARLVISASQVLVYDASNVLRVRMGVW